MTLEETDMDVGGLADRAMKRGGTTEPNHIICQVVPTILSRDQLHKNGNRSDRVFDGLPGTLNTSPVEGHVQQYKEERKSLERTLSSHHVEKGTWLEMLETKEDVGWNDKED